MQKNTRMLRGLNHKYLQMKKKKKKKKKKTKKKKEKEQLVIK